jgi:Xaa-Pro aminopeptidase
VIELIEGFGARVVSSGALISRFAARWSPSELAGHRRAAEAIAAIANEALRWAGSELARGTAVRETVVQARVMEGFARAGLVTDHPPIVGFQANAANPHYEPLAGADRQLAAGDVLLLDLWAGVAPAGKSVFADQTWMAFAGRDPSDDVRRVWCVVRDARDAAVALLRERWKQREPVTGAALDDAARGVITAAGFGEYFVHRTGHSIDRDLHGSGPHLDNFETADERTLIPGVGFSVEPGIYLPGRFGMRTEINVYLREGEEGPEVTPKQPQKDLLLV